MRQHQSLVSIFVAVLMIGICSVPGYAEDQAGLRRMAVLDFHDSSAGAVKPQEVLYLSDLVRGAARRTLPAERFLLMTRENIQELLPQGRSLADCVGDCAVETGRKIGADYVATGDVTTFANEIRVTVNLHETASGNLLGQIRAGAPDLLGVEQDLDAKILGLLRPLRGGGEGAGSANDVEVPLGGGAKAWSASGQAKEVVSFDSVPGGAMVEVDEQPIGETPCRRALALGTYRVDIKKVRYVSYSQVLEVKTGRPGAVNTNLVPDFGWVTVESEPAGLSVSIDGKKAGVTPMTKQEIDTGTHDILVTSDDYHEEGRRIVVDRAEVETIHVAPVPRNGGLTVIAVDVQGNATTATVKIDGRNAGRAYEPITALRGKHQVEVVGAGGTWKGEYAIVEEMLGELQVKLAAAPADLQMVQIPAGSFLMGSPASEGGRDSDEDQRTVKIASSFYMSSTEITQAQYQLVMDSNPSGFKGAHLPVEQVTWADAVEFCNRLSAREGWVPCYVINGSKVSRNPEGNGYRLPSETEWEYACRAGTASAYNSGETESNLAKAAWYVGNSSGATHEVGAKAPNAWGLFDMHGNVWEWCDDWYSQVFPDGRTSAANGTKRVVRGGAWNFDGRTTRSAFRSWYAPQSAINNLGFRVVREGP